jgi:protein arginine N-methyltransferase 1
LFQILDEHREYLSDPNRIDAFSRAVAEIVKPGDVVIDLGSGSGILGLLACRAGARRVYAIDNCGLTQLEREIFAANGFADRVVCIKGFSTRVSLPEPADVVLCDQLGYFGFNAGIIEFLSDARHRLLKPGGGIIPARFDLCVAPVEAPETWVDCEFWKRPCAGFDMTPAYAAAVNTGYARRFGSNQAIAPPETILSIDLARDSEIRISGKALAAFARDAVMHGLAGWFDAELSPSVRMTNSPFAVKAIRRPAFFLPLDPTTVRANERFEVAITIVPRESLISWTVEIIGADARPRARFSHSTFRGMLLCPEDLRKAAPDFVPTLNDWGEARRTVFALCDGRRNLREIENEVLRQHANLFPSSAEAAAFVAEVMVPYVYEDSNF